MQSVNTNSAQFWATEVIEQTYLTTKIMRNKMGGGGWGSCNKLIREVDFPRQRFNFFQRFCSKLEDFRDDMIPLCLKWNRKWYFRHLLQTFVIVFLYHFWPVLFKVANYPNTWFTRSFLALSANKSTVKPVLDPPLYKDSCMKWPWFSYPNAMIFM